MLDDKFLFIAAVFVVAGFVKGVIGLGLPTIAMGLLAIVMTPLEAAAVLLLPSLLTNVWQMIAGPSLRSALLRLWPMLITLCLATWAAADLMTGAHARYGGMALGVALMAYAVTSLGSFVFSIKKTHEAWLGPLTGALTGLVTAATGVFVLPSVPYVQAIGLEKEELIQALGLTFTVATLALTINVARAGALTVALAGPTLTALAAAAVGVGLGQTLRLRLPPALFRRCFFAGLLLVGLYLVVSPLA